jgi:CRISPR-associated endonuclease/helicase Cas3
MKEDYIAHWRKSDQKPQYLWDHLEEAATYAGQAAEKIGLKETGEILGWLHDLGKASTVFQNYIRSATGLLDPDADGYTDVKEHKGKIDHSTAGAQFIYNTLHNHGPEREITAEILSLCIASHHSGLIDALSPAGKNDFLDRMKKSDGDTHLPEVLSHLTDDERSFLTNLLQNENPSKQLIEKLRTIKEPNDHQDTYLFKCGLLIRYLFSCVIDADRLSTADFDSPGNLEIKNYGNYQSWDVLEQRLNIAINNINQNSEASDVNKIRRQVSESCYDFAEKPRGLYQLTVPTGGGKTLSSLRFAIRHARLNQLDHIFYIIPYTSIIDQNADKVRKILEDLDPNGKFLDRVVLEHHSNLTPNEESFRHNLLAENWDAPVIFTTQVQFLETLFGSRTRSPRRMHQLANSVLIFDEIQTLSVRCVHMFDLAVRFLVNNCGSSVVLCTATQPLLDKVEPIQRALRINPEQHIISDEKKLFTILKRVDVFDERKPGGWTDSEVSDLVEQQVQEKGNVLIVVNTKKSARSLYQTIASKNLEPLYHLSTNMCPAHRLDKLDEMREKLQNHQPVVCVSTQLIEAGVDIDFGCVIRYLAGLDSITQAAGRCNREGKPTPGNVWIVNPADENLKNLQDIQQGVSISEKILGEFKADPMSFDDDLLGFKAIEDYYKYYFFQRKEEMCYRVGNADPAGHNDNLVNMLSLNEVARQEYQNQWNAKPSIPFIQSFKSAARSFSVIDSATQGVIVPYGEGKNIIPQLTGAFNLQFMHKQIRAAQRFSVNLFPNQMKTMADQHAIYEIQEDAGIYYLDDTYYSEKFGWSDIPVKEMENHIH